MTDSPQPSPRAGPPSPSGPLSAGPRSPAAVAALVLWSVVLLIIFARAALKPHENTVFATYAAAGQDWMAGRPLYSTVGGFVYSPLVAAFFAPFALLPAAVGNTVWRLLNVAVFASAVFYWLGSSLSPDRTRRRAGLVFLLLLPLALGNFNNGQVNPMVVGFLMFSIVAAQAARWNTSAGFVAAATYLKLYPLVLGLLLALMFPRKLAWRLLCALLLLGGATFLLQRPSYVLGQYHDWFLTRLQDDRHLYNQRAAPRDLWLLLHALHLPVSALAYKILQVATGALIAVYVVVARLRGRALASILANTFTLSICWMLLCGPAAESATYVILAPAVVFTCTGAAGSLLRAWSRVLAFISLALLLVALAFNSFSHLNHTLAIMAIQPMAAALFAAMTVATIVRPAPSLLAVTD